MGNPIIVAGSAIPNASALSDLENPYVFSVILDGKSIPVSTREGESDDKEPSRSDPTFVIVEAMNTLAPGSKSGNSEPLVYRPPFISETAWYVKDADKNRGGVQREGSFASSATNSFFPHMLCPDKLLLANGLEDYKKEGDAPDSVVHKHVWNWQITKDNEVVDDLSEIPTYAQVIDDSRPQNTMIKVSESAANQAADQPGKIVFMLDLTNKAYRNAKMFDASEIDLLKGTSKENYLGSFTLLFSDVTPIKKLEENLTVPPGGSAQSSDQSKTSYSVVIRTSSTKNGTKFTAVFEKNATLKVSLGDSETMVNLPAPAVQAKSSTAVKEPLALTFVPVFNGVLVSTGVYQGYDVDQQKTMTTFCQKTPNLDFSNFIVSPFNPESPSDVRVDNKKESLVDVGDIMEITFINCKASFAYVPVFFTPQARGAYYLISQSEGNAGNDVSSSDDSSEPKYKLFPVWCKNRTAATLYYPQGSFEYGSDDSTFEGNEAVNVMLTSTDRLAVSSARGIVEEPVGGGTTARGYVIFTISGKNTAQPGATANVTGGTVSGSMTISKVDGQEVWCQSNRGNFGPDPQTDTHLEVAQKSQAKKIRFGFNSGKQSEPKGGWQKDQSNATSDGAYSESDKDAISRFGTKSSDDSLYTRFPPQLFGFMMLRLEKITFDLKNGNGSPISFGNNWMQYIKTVSVSHGEGGSSGSVVIDRYGLKQLTTHQDFDVMTQQVGSLNLNVQYVSTTVDTSAKTYAVNLGNGTLFRGIGYGQGVTDSPEANELQVPLFGLQKKLEEIRIINAPFFDSKTVAQTLDFLSRYGNVVMNLDNANQDDRMPASAVLSSALVDFKLGTSVWDAMNFVAEHSAHVFMLQPDGKVWWYKISKVNGLPHTSSGHREWKYSDARVTASSASPDFSQFYNFILVFAYSANGMSMSNPLQQIDTVPTRPLVVGSRLNNTNPKIAWDKLASIPLNGFWTSQMLNEQARNYGQMSQSIYWSGSTTIPLNLGIKLYDTFSNTDRDWRPVTGDSEVSIRGDFLINGINHEVDMASKTGTTTLQLMMIGNILYSQGQWTELTA